jgi:hypothetical protein
MAEQLLDEVRELAAHVQVRGAGLARIDALLDRMLAELLPESAA